MGRPVTFLLFLILPLVFSCQRHDPAMSEPPGPVTKPNNDFKTFTTPVIAFIYPDVQQTDSLKEAMGADRYFAFSDMKGAEFSKVRSFSEKNRLATWSGITAKYRFVTADGTTIEVDLRHTQTPWKLIIFNGNDAPVLANPEDAGNILLSTFNLFPEHKGKRIRQSLPATIPIEPTVVQPGNPGSSFESIPGRKEATLRLVIFPGQAPPPLRNETAGIRIVNSYISPNRRFWLEFDNDMFSNTDRYYTNGVVLGYSSPALTTWRLNRFMINRNKNSVVHSAISLHHGMFTPITTKEPPPLVNDRPYASTLYLRYSRFSEDAEAGILLSSAIEAGVIGDAALGQLLQKSVHAGIPSNDEPQGWETQIKNDLVLNYTIDIRKQLAKSGNAELYAEGSATAGTLHTRAGMGIFAIAGSFNPGLTPVPENFSRLTQTDHNWQYGIRGGLEMRMVGYDASLQGGLLNRNNVFALKPDEIERLVAALNVGLFAGYKKFGLSISQYYLSPEFKSGKQHFWGQIGLNYGW